MWHSGDYRIIFRHESFPRPEQIQAAADKMWVHGCITDLSQRYEKGRAILSDKVLQDTRIISVVVIQKRICENDLCAWATLGVGYAFCNRKDHFIKREGRQIAFERALLQVPEAHYTQVVSMWNSKASKLCRPLDVKGV